MGNTAHVQQIRCEPSDEHLVLMRTECLIMLLFSWCGSFENKINEPVIFVCVFLFHLHQSRGKFMIETTSE